MHICMNEIYLLVILQEQLVYSFDLVKFKVKVIAAKYNEN